MGQQNNLKRPAQGGCAEVPRLKFNVLTFLYRSSHGLDSILYLLGRSTVDGRSHVSPMSFLTIRRSTSEPQHSTVSQKKRGVERFAITSNYNVS